MNTIQMKMRYFLNKIMKTSLINRWIVFGIDLILCMMGYSFAAYIQIRNSHMDIAVSRLWLAGVVFITSTILSFYTLKSYRGLIRHSSFMEMWRIFVSMMFSCLVLYLFIVIFGYTFDYRYFFVQNVFLISMILLLIMRYFIVLIYNYSVNYTTEVRNRSLIYEIDTHSIALAQWLNKSAANQYQVQGFVIRKKNASRTRVQGFPVYNLNSDKLDWFLRKNEINNIIFPDYTSVRNEQAFISTCIEMGISIQVSPPFEGLDSNNKFHFKMKPIQFEDLLGRDEITVDMVKIE